MNSLIRSDLCFVIFWIFSITSSTVGFAFFNGPLYFSMPGKIGNKNYSYQYWCNSLDFFTSVGLAYDANGHSYAVAAGGDINVNTADKFVFMTDIFGKANENKEGYSTKLSGKGIRIESVGMIGTKGNTSDTTKYFEKQRIKSSSLATSVHDDNTNVYLAYYDSMTDEIRFKYGNTGNIVASNNRTYEIKVFNLDRNMLDEAKVTIEPEDMMKTHLR